MAIEIVDFPIKNGGSFHSYVTNYQRVMFRVVPRKHQGHRWHIPMIHRCHWPSFNCWQLGTSMEQPWASTKTKVAKPRATSTFLGMVKNKDSIEFHPAYYKYMITWLHDNEHYQKKKWQNHCIKYYVYIYISKQLYPNNCIQIYPKSCTS